MSPGRFEISSRQRSVLLDSTGRKYVEIDKAYMRPTDVAEPPGDSSKAAEKLGWHTVTSFDEMVHEMLEHDLKLEGVDPSKYLRHPPARVAP